MRPDAAQASRDLAWVLASPGLMDHPLCVDDTFGARELQLFPGTFSRLGQPGSSLDKAVQRLSGGRLGDYFETLLGTWFDEVAPAKILAKNLQVQGPHGTVGEFDLVFQRDAEIHHWELAVKFYLAHPGPHDEPHWYGPNPQDRLDLKWSKMVQKQSQLSLTPEGAKVLQKRGIKHVEPSVFVKGVLYEPLNEAYQVEHHPDTNPQGLRGWWVHHGQVDRLLQQTQGCQWLYLPRLFWLSEASADRQRPGPLEVLDVASRSPVHVAAMRLEDGVWHEQSRGFIVPDSWPGGL